MQSTDFNIIETRWSELRCAVHVWQPKNVQDPEAVCHEEQIALPPKKKCSFTTIIRGCKLLSMLKGPTRDIKKQGLYLTRAIYVISIMVMIIIIHGNLL